MNEESMAISDVPDVLIVAVKVGVEVSKESGTALTRRICRKKEIFRNC